MRLRWARGPVGMAPNIRAGCRPGVRVRRWRAQRARRDSHCSTMFLVSATATCMLPWKAIAGRVATCGVAGLRSSSRKAIWRRPARRVSSSVQCRKLAAASFAAAFSASDAGRGLDRDASTGARQRRGSARARRGRSARPLRDRVRSVRAGLRAPPRIPSRDRRLRCAAARRAAALRLR